MGGEKRYDPEPQPADLEPQPADPEPLLALWADREPLPADRQRAGLHHLDGYYDLRNHIVDFLVSRAKPQDAH